MPDSAKRRRADSAERLAKIVALARETGFDHVQVNTNGIRLAQDGDYGQALKDAGTTDFFIQFDGLTDVVYEQIRGAELLRLKLDAIKRCSELKIGVILVPTLIRNCNEDQIGSIIRLAKDWIPTVKGVHFSADDLSRQISRIPAQRGSHPHARYSECH